ncbi:MAG: hypothetical protein ACYDH9_22030 [Limisphaerales bacterium]
MATDPQRNADELLKAYAQKRRAEAGAPAELHPATRKLLQDEVARTFRQAAPEPKASVNRFAGWRLRWAWSGAVVAIVAAVALMIWPPVRKSPEPLQLAQRAKERTGGPVDRLGVSPERDTVQRAPTPAVPALTAHSAVAGNERTRMAMRRVQASPPPAGRGAEDVAGRRTGDVVALALAQRQEKDAAKQIAPGPGGGGVGGSAGLAGNSAAEAKSANLAASANDLSRAAANNNNRLRLAVANEQPASSANTMTASSAANQRQVSLAENQALDAFSNAATGGESLRFVQLDSRAKYRRNFTSPVPPTILTSFRIERAKDQVRVVDADESVYEGQVVIVPAGDTVQAVDGATSVRLGSELKTELTVTQNAPLAEGLTSGPPAGGGVNYSFRVSGTNRSLQQLVVFSGAFVSGTGSPSSNGAVVAAKRPADARYFAAPSPGSSARPLGDKATGSSAAGQSGAKSVENQSLPAGFIQGKVVVGGTSEFNLEAIPVAR